MGYPTDITIGQRYLVSYLPDRQYEAKIIYDHGAMVDIEVIKSIVDQGKTKPVGNKFSIPKHIIQKQNSVSWKYIDSDESGSNMKYGTSCAKCSYPCPDAQATPNYTCWACRNGF